MFLKPDFILNDITEIDLSALKNQGIQGFIFDLDNTLMAPKTGKLEPWVEHWLHQVQEAGFQCIVVSNNKRPAYVEAAGKTLGIPAISHAQKPRRKYFYEALEHLQLAPHQVAVVGDRPLTDIWGGQRLGAITVLVEPLTKKTEPGMIQFLRKLERLSLCPEVCHD